MKSSTIRRSTLSRESMEVIENIASQEPLQEDMYSSDSSGDLPDEYVRVEKENKTQDNKSQEIDLLWQTFKSAQFNTQSPIMTAVLGFILGVITTLVIVAMFGTFNSSGSHKLKLSEPVTLEQQAENAKGLIASDETYVAEDEPAGNSVETTDAKAADTTETQETVNPQEFKKYVVKDGDTGESIIKKYYGSFTIERAENIKKANKLQSLDRLSIDQVLLLPVEK